jgi:hypothetical protein
VWSRSATTRHLTPHFTGEQKDRPLDDRAGGAHRAERVKANRIRQGRAIATVVEVRTDGLFLDGELAIANLDIRSATMCLHEHGRHRVFARSRRLGESVELVLDRAASATRLVRELELAARRQPASLHVYHPRMAVVVAMVAGAVGQIAFPSPLVVVGVILVCLASSIVTRSRFVIGGDGLLVTRLGTSKRVAYGDLVSAEADGDGRRLRLRLRDGDEMWFDASYGRSGPMVELARSIQDAKSAAKEEQAHHPRTEARDGEDDAPPEPRTRLSRAGRPVRDWLDDLRRQAVQGYRDGYTPDEALWTLVEGSDSDPAERFAAGVVLHARHGIDVNARLRVVINDAPPRLRVALDTLARDDDEELERHAGHLAAE